MYTITLTYDPDNVIAQQSLDTLLATGQFITLDKKLSGDELEKSVVADIQSKRPAKTYAMGDDSFEVIQRAHVRAMQKEYYTPEEAYRLIMKEIKAVYDRTPEI